MADGTRTKGGGMKLAHPATFAGEESPCSKSPGVWLTSASTTAAITQLRRNT